MPLSDFGLSPRSQVFQVFSNKRKHDWTENDGDQNNLQVEAAAKRVCPEPTDEGDAMNKMLEINHNSIPQEVVHQQLGMQQDPAQLQQVQEHYRQQQQLQLKLQEEILQQQQLQQQQSQNNMFTQPSSQFDPNTMVMDLCDETYSNVELDPQTRTMYSNMDSDCVPDLQQYGGGDRSPTSGRVRCYCKPSWEGLMEMRPYVSDYY